MPGFGWNAFPREFGGGKSLEQKAYETLRDSEGIGGWDPDEENSIDSLIRYSQALGHAAAESFIEAAARQVYPHLATDHIPVLEDILGIVQQDGDDEELRRRRVATEWVRVVSGVVQDIRAELQEIDERFDTLDVDWENEISTEIGKPFERLDGADAFDSIGGRMSTGLPNYSSEFVLRVIFDLGSGVMPNEEELAKIEQAKFVIRRAIPSWMTFSLGTELGFILDTSRLDGAMLEDV